MLARLKRAWDGLLWLVRPTGLRRSLALLEERLHRMEARQLEMESRLSHVASPTNVPIPVHGHYLVVDRCDTLGLSLHHTHEPYLTELVEKIVQPTWTVVDAGAHIGYFSLLFARRAARVLAFEPSPHAHALLRRNLDSNGYPRVELHEAALHSGPGRLTFHTCEDGLAGGSVHHPGGGFRWQTLEVAAQSLDALLSPGARVDLVKLDIQGGEGHALAGMRRCLSDNPGVQLLVELWPRGLATAGTPARAVLESLAGQGFTFTDVRETERAMVPMTVDELVARYPETGQAHTNLLCQRR